ncbi:MAG: ion transporter [Oscillospiraceae bacterium]|nr:ion transporter [Oscillospiraceae bacterium]
MKESEQIQTSDFRSRVFRMVSVGVVDVPINQAYDIISTAMLLINLAGAFAVTFDSVEAQYGSLLGEVEAVTVAFFAIDYFLRLYTSPCLYPGYKGLRPYVKYVLSGAGIIDLLSFLPYYLPMFFPAGAVAFRLIRVARILRLFRINAYYDSLNVITNVIVSKSQQLLSSVFIIFVLMLASSLAMYSIEHTAQPEIFRNAFSGLWWAVSTLLTVGYGDIYPVTVMGKCLGIVITFLGVGMVAIPTGIISAGFVEQYTHLQRISDYGEERDLRFVKIELSAGDNWSGKKIQDLNLPRGIIVAVVQRGSGIIVPRGDVILKAGDCLVLGAEGLKGDRPINLKEITLKKNHEWNDHAIMDLDISRQTYIVMVRRDGQAMVPNGKLVLQAGDTVILYSREHLSDEKPVSI